MECWIMSKYIHCNVCGRRKAPRGYTCGACSRTIRRWGTNYKVVTLKHISSTARKVHYFYPSKELQVGLEYYLTRYKLTSPYSISHTARVLCMCGVYASKEYIEYGNSFMTYLIYLMGGDEAHQQYRDRTKDRYKLIDNLQSFVFQVEGKSYRLFGTLLTEAKRLEQFIEDKDIEVTKVYKKEV